MKSLCAVVMLIGIATAVKLPSFFSVDELSQEEIDAAVHEMKAPWDQEDGDDVLRKHVGDTHTHTHTMKSAMVSSFPGFQLVPPSPHTEVQCKGPSYNVTCKFKNLYFIAGGFKAYFPAGFIPPAAMNNLMSLHRFAGHEPPQVMYSSPPGVERIIPGTTLHYSTIWHQNIGHFLWDGLYPAYVALTQWDLQGNDFNTVATYAQDCFQAGAPNGRCMSEDIMRRFGGKKVEFLIKNTMRNSYRFEQFVMGSGHKGARTINRDVSCWGSRDLDALRSFRDRLYQVYDLKPPPRRISSQENRQTRSLKAIIIDNKRFTWSEIQAFKLLAKEMSAETSKNLHVEYINYADTHHDFGKQLRLLQNADIHVSGIGTGNSYSDFMPDGSVLVNLGNPRQSHDPFEGKGAYKNVAVGFMEEYWSEGNTHARALYYPVTERRAGLTKSRVQQLLGEAASLIRSDFSMPVKPGVNLSPIGQIFKEYCYAAGPRLCDPLINCMNGDLHRGGDCPAWPDSFVWEAGDFAGSRCGNIDRPLLQKIRKKYVGI